MVWRDTWDAAPDVVIIAPGDVRNGAIHGAIVLMATPRQDPHLTVIDGLGRRYLVALPRHLLSEDEHYNVETRCTLRVTQAAKGSP